MRQTTVAAVDLGASSGRVMTGHAGTGRLELREVHRFPNRPVATAGTLHWDILRLYADLLDGLAAAARDTKLASVGIDSWGVDYGLIGAGGALLGNPVHYRDARTNGVLDQVLAAVPAAELYAVTGVQQLQINTVCQLVAASLAGQLDRAATMLLIPDLLSYWLTGEVGAELTNASTTQLYDPRARSWAWDVIERLGLPRTLFPPLRQPGTVIGTLRPELAAEPGLAGLGQQRRRTARRRSPGASWTTWPWPTGGPSPRSRSCPAGRPRWCTWWAAGHATTSCSSSPPTPAACP